MVASETHSETWLDAGNLKAAVLCSNRGNVTNRISRKPQIAEGRLYLGETIPGNHAPSHLKPAKVSEASIAAT